MDKKKIYENYVNNNYADENLGSSENYKKYYKILKSNIGDIILSKSKKSKILDLGCGSGRTAYFFNKMNFTDYDGVDISSPEISIAKKNFKEYNFYKDDIISFLNNSKKKYDIIIMYHVFEHLTKEQGFNLLLNIKRNLSDEGFFINVMPNASAYFNSTSMLYADITHEVVYNQHSFNQILVEAGFNKIIFKNMKIGKNYIQRIIHKLVLSIFELFILTLGYSKYKIYTSSMITLARK